MQHLLKSIRKKMTYQEFIQSKQHISINSGIEPNFFPEMLFPFQKHVSEYAIKKGRAATIETLRQNCDTRVWRR